MSKAKEMLDQEADRQPGNGCNCRDGREIGHCSHMGDEPEQPVAVRVAKLAAAVQQEMFSGGGLL